MGSFCSPFYLFARHLALSFSLQPNKSASVMISMASPRFCTSVLYGPYSKLSSFPQAKSLCDALRDFKSALGVGSSCQPPRPCGRPAARLRRAVHKFITSRDTVNSKTSKQGRGQGGREKTVNSNPLNVDATHSTLNPCTKWCIGNDKEPAAHLHAAMTCGDTRTLRGVGLTHGIRRKERECAQVNLRAFVLGLRVQERSFDAPDLKVS